MSVQPLLLTERQIPWGAVVFLCQPGSAEPATDADGPLPPLRCLRSGVPVYGKLHPSGSIKSVEGGGLMSSSLENFKPDTRFLPVETFSPNDAPQGGKFAVFVEGQALLYGRLGIIGIDAECPVHVWKQANGDFLFSDALGFNAKEFFSRGAQNGTELVLPDGAVLVPTELLGRAAELWH